MSKRHKKTDRTTRRPRSRRARKTGQSPYARHGKSPCAYSAAYQQWRAGMRKQIGGAAKRQDSNYLSN